MCSSIVDFFVRRLPWVWGAGIIAAAIGYFLFIQNIMQIGKDQIVGPAWDLQKQFYVSIDSVREALQPATGEFLKMFSVLVLDIPIALLTATALATLIGWAVRIMNFESSRWRFLVVLPLAYGAFDLLEDTALALSLAFSGTAEFLVVIFVPLKQITLAGAGAVSGLFLGVASIFWLRKKIRRA